MTVAEALREINKANSRLYRLQKGQFEGVTPASRALEQNIERLGASRTKKGYISTKGLAPQTLIGLGRQAQKFNVSKTASTRGAIQDIRARTGTWQSKARDIVASEFTPDTAQRIWRIFDSKTYKRLKESYGSDAVVAMAIRKLNENPDINIKNWLYREELKYRKGQITEEQLLFGKEGSWEDLDLDADLDSYFSELDSEDF